MGQEAANVIVAGAGIAGLEFAMALADMAGRRARITVVAPEGYFVLKPLVVREPFGGPGLERFQLGPLLARIGAEHVLDAVTRVNPDRKAVTLRGARSLDYDYLAICIGGLARPAYASALTFWTTSGRMPVNDLIERAASSPSRTLAIAVPPGMSWPLPAYELALMMRRRAEEMDRDPRIVVLTPESAPLAIFGARASAAVSSRLRARRVEVETARVTETGRGLVRDGGGEVDAGAVIALPRIDGADIPGLPSERGGFIPVDEHCRVIGLDDVYAAGDGTSFPVKQGGIACQQADAAAAHLASRLGADVAPEPFDPVLRGELLTGDDSIKMLHRVDEAGPGEISPDYLWWPRSKVGGRYLSAWLAGTTPRADMEPRELPIDVEASWPHNWRGERF